MKQVLQNLQNGIVAATDVPCPLLSSNSLLIRTTTSLISSGTERMLMEFGKAGWIEKARQQPDRVKLVLEKAKVDGVVATLESVRSKLAQPIPLGYSNAGVVLAAGENVRGFKPGDRVASNGAHAEVVSVPSNLCARIPSGVSEEAASFTVLGAIALEGIRLAQPVLGESVAVIGLGLIGLLAVQLLRASGSRVLAIDYNQDRLRIAERYGAQAVDIGAGQDPVSAALRFSSNQGMDAVLITAATKSNTPVHQAALMSRKRGRIVLVGVAGLELSRDDFYKKELSFQVSCSYGPGRYDPAYEQGGRDYPLPYVRWTAQRNFQAVLEMLADGKLDTGGMVSHRIPFERVEEAYELIETGQPHLGVVLAYPKAEQKPDTALRTQTIRIDSREQPAKKMVSGPALAFIGAGNYASKILIPAFRKGGAQLDLVISSGGVSAASAARRFGFSRAGTDQEQVFADPAIDMVAIATRHDSHANLVIEGLRKGKSVFVEKPLALTLSDLERIAEASGELARSGRLPWLLVGFNRRFAPLVSKMKSLLRGLDGPKNVVITVNAGAAAGDWTVDPVEGGGRIVGEACHFIDLLRYLADCPSDEVRTINPRLGDSTNNGSQSFSLTFEDGSVGTIHYFASGHRSFPKERIEVFCGGRVLQLDNFRMLRGWGFQNFSCMKLWRQNKGANEMAVAAIQSVRSEAPSPIPIDELIEVSRVAIEVAHG